MTERRAPNLRYRTAVRGSVLLSQQVRIVAALKFLFTALLQILLTVWFAVTVSFFALALVPGDPVSIRLGPLAKISAADKAALREQLGLGDPLPQQYLRHLGDLLTVGLGDPLPQQYLRHLGDLLTGDLGYSYHQKLPVAEIIGRQAAATFELTIAALAGALLLVLLGQVIKRAGTRWGSYNNLRQNTLTAAHTIAVSTPSFWVGYLLLMVFAFHFKIFPVGGAASFGALVLPAVTLAIPVSGLLGQVIDTELDALENKPFALSSRARGMSRWRFMLAHGALHTVPAAGTLAGNIVGGLFGGAVLTETVFVRPGLGKVALDAVLQRDMPTVLGLVAVSALIFATLGQLIELFIKAADPQQRGASA